MIINVDDVRRFRDTIQKGQSCTFETPVWVDSYRSETMQYTGTIEGKYNYGMEVSFMFKGRKQRRWLAYSDVLIGLSKGQTPFAGTYKTSS